MTEPRGTRWLKQTVTITNEKGEVEKPIEKFFETQLSNCQISKRLKGVPGRNVMELRQTGKTEFNDRNAAMRFEILTEKPVVADPKPEVSKPDVPVSV